MFKIGDFSKLSQVSIKALRYYDELGLLKPTHIDPFTGYRYYSAEQLSRLNRILVLKDLALSLEQIAALLGGDLSADQMRGMLQRKRTELEKHVLDEQARLARLEARLSQIEQEDLMASYDVVLKHIGPQPVASMRDVLPTYGDVGRLYGPIFAQLGRHGTRPAGPPMAVYYDHEFREHDVDVEAAVPIVPPVQVDQPVTIHELPGVEAMACLIYQGSYEGFSKAYAALMAWIETNAYRICGPNREVYLKGPEAGGDPAAYVTELQVPVEKA